MLTCLRLILLTGSSDKDQNTDGFLDIKSGQTVFQPQYKSVLNQGTTL